MLKDLTVVGWREIVCLPKLKLHDVRAKIDTGAKTQRCMQTILRLSLLKIKRSSNLTMKMIPKECIT